MADIPPTGLRLQSTVKNNGTLELALADVPVAEPTSDQVIIQVEAAPINPSDLGVMFGLADVTSATQSGTADRPVITAQIPEKVMGAMKGRLDLPIPCGNEGAGTVVKAGDSDAAQALLGKKVAGFGGAMYAQFRTAGAAEVMPLPADATARDGASCFVNPLTALGMTETMRLEGHTALVHTAAASNLGQMLNKICIADGIQLVNIVRKPEQAALLKELGANYVVNSSTDSFMADLTDALAETGATIAFDATGGGRLANNILIAMEQAAQRNASGHAQYGSTVHKQVYIYGGLDRSTTELTRNYGMAWGIGGWLLPNFMARVGMEVMGKLQARVAAELKTTFASHYTNEVSLAEALTMDALSVYGKMTTGEKFLINPSKGL